MISTISISINVYILVLNPQSNLLLLNGNSEYISRERGVYLELVELSRKIQKVLHTKQEEAHLHFYTYDLCLKISFPRAIEIVKKPTTEAKARTQFPPFLVLYLTIT